MEEDGNGEPNRRADVPRRRNGEPSTPGPSATRAEWVVAGVSALMVSASVGYLLYEAVTSPDAPAIITLEVDRIVEAGDLYVVTFWAHNHGGETASDLVVEGEIVSPEGESLEVRQMTFNFVPTESRRRGGLFFSENPLEQELVLRPVGYDRP